MYDPCTAGIRNKGRAHDYIVLLSLDIAEWRSIALADKVRTRMSGQDRVFALKHLIHEVLRQDVHAVFLLNTHIFHFRVHRECHMRRKRPRGSRPGQHIISAAFELELGCSTQILNGLVALRHFMGAQRRLTARAIRADAVSAVHQAFVMHSRQDVPHAFDIRVI
ncbi:hypothetical protein D3C75_549450 [compost metagenome]